jgi:large subunit ribosomal protein L17
MKHGRKLKKLNRTSSHRKSLLMNLAISLFKHERIKTTLAKAKAVRPYAEKLITKAKQGDKSLHIVRQLSAMISDKSVVKKLVEELSQRFKKRPGGYTRIYKAGFRANDSAPIALIELVDYAGKAPATEAAPKASATIKDKLTSLIKPKEDTKNASEPKQEAKPAAASKKPKAAAKPVAKSGAKKSK